MFSSNELICARGLFFVQVSVRNGRIAFNRNIQFHLVTIGSHIRIITFNDSFGRTSEIVFSPQTVAYRYAFRIPFTLTNTIFLSFSFQTQKHPKSNGLSHFRKETVGRIRVITLFVSGKS